MKETEENDLNKRFEYFKIHLENIEQLPFLTYSQMLENKHFGLYLVYRQSTLMYVGKTNREVNKRIREMGGDHRSHTLNRKILQEEINLFLNNNELMLIVNNSSKKNLIDTEKLTENQFAEIQNKVKNIIKQQFHFKFYPCDESNLSRMECFLIGFLSPHYNN